LLAGLVRAVAVVVAGLRCERHRQVPFAVDQHRAGALGPYGAHPPPGMAIGPWRPRRGRDCPEALAGEDLVEHGSERGVAVAEEDAARGDLAAAALEEVAGLLGGPCAIRVGHAGGCARAGSPRA